MPSDIPSLSPSGGPSSTSSNAPTCILGTATGELESYGDTPGCLLRRCAGDCDSDDDCVPGLFCIDRNSAGGVGGCVGTPESNGYDYCTDNSCLQVTEGVLETVGSVGSNPSCLLHACQGDCNTDSDCVEGLFCMTRTFNETVQDCTGAPENDFQDYCVTNNPNP